MIAVEAARGLEWFKFADHVYGMKGFGASGKAAELFSHFGFEPTALSEFAKGVL